ncbi:MAG TPA: hypothetical protein DCO86_00260 [Spirochaetaceae bacterium]|nr:hypothetical protein [Spirochaetaceae bacterium]
MVLRDYAKVAGAGKFFCRLFVLKALFKALASESAGRLFIFIVLFAAVSHQGAFADNRADISLLSVDSPSSIYYNDKSLIAIDSFFAENLNFPESAMVHHQIDAAATVAGPRIGMRISIGSFGSGNLRKAGAMSIVNYFDIKVASSFGYGDLAFGFSWNISGEREREVSVSSIGESFADYFEYILVKHNDSNIRGVESDFAFQVSYRFRDILSLCAYADRFLSLSSQAVSFSMESVLSSIGFSFAIKLPKYDRNLSLRSLLAELHMSFFDLFSESPASDMDLRIKFVLSGRMDVTLSNMISFGDFSNVISTSSHIVSVICRSGDIMPFVSFVFPFDTYAGTTGIRYVRFKLGLKYVM